MADPNHLEKMGRELKCPICLSLFNSAVSLNCNHLFCNLCIVKSMRTDSSCPVCKVPFQRREIRAAPHMDNLVNVYKSMEVASGVNIFVTQNAPSDENKQALDDCSPIVENTNESGKNKTRGKAKRKRNGPGKAVKSSEKLSGSTSAKPSFPAKKRVQVPKNAVSETPALHEDNEGGLVENEKCKSKNLSSTLEKKFSFNENGHSGLLPFFWLREKDNDDDDEVKSTQHSDRIHSQDGLTPDVPSFSDIKDSDDERSSSPTAEMHGMGNDAAFIDSEMFEWTQRACSPELCSSPIKMQVPDSEENEGNGNHENEYKDPLLNSKTNDEQKVLYTTIKKPEQETVVSDLAFPDLSSPMTKKSNGLSGSKKSKKGGRKGGKAVQKKCAKGSADLMTESCVDLNEASENFQQVENNHSSDTILISKKTSTRRKCVELNGIAAGPTAEQASSGFAGVQVPCQREKDPVPELPSLSSKRNSKDEHFRLTINNKSGKISPAVKNCSLKADKGKSSNSIMQSQQKHNRVMMVQVSSLRQGDSSKEIDCTEKKSKSHGKRKSATKLSCSTVSRCKKKLKASPIGTSNAESSYGNKNQEPSVVSANSELLNKTETEVIAQKNAATDGNSKLADAVLRKCQALSDKINCAFCHSSKDSEELGEIVHYSNGKPVAADYSGDTKVIHSHKTCAEWAPNVYFEESNAINLEAELARSRRIKCSLCGMKGAALGCYETSCRKSFHVPCAKSVSQCRWDMDNFVMLCPLHPSSKLPNESVLKENKKNCAQNGRSHGQRIKPSNKHRNNTDQNWSSHGPNDRLIISCSALSAAEKETISEFAKLSGARVLKSYDSSVTHVIASTDENGACRRTLKVLMGILGGKWILSIAWVNACIKAQKRVTEEQYEITIDIHGIRDGPRLGRLRLLNKEPKLFNGCKFYLMGDFVPSYKGYIQNLITAAGGTILHRKPICGDQEVSSSDTSEHSVFIVYSLELPDKCDMGQKSAILAHRQSNAEALARSSGAEVASNTWILNSVAACRLQVI